jgi:hypothetical protein
VSFTGELITHPIWMLFLLPLPQITHFLPKIMKNRAKVLLLSFLILFGFVVFGSTFGYAAWHQSGGLLVLFTPFLLALTSLLGKRNYRGLLSHKLIFNSMLIMVAILIFGLLLRGLYFQERRAVEWDRNLVKNYCIQIKGSDEKFLGAEIRYWPLGLGIEDVNRWQWMSDDYAAWLKTLSPILPSKCSTNN